MSLALHRITLLLVTVTLLSSAQAFEQPTSSRHKTLPATGTIELAFAPEDDATGLIVHAIDEAKKQVLVQAFSFTSREIATALIHAHRRGIDVQLIADLGQTEKIERNRISEIAAGGVPVLIDSRHVAAHNKVMIIDAGTPNAALVTGSFNFTYGAQKNNAENLLVFRGNAQLVQAYAENWQRHRIHASPYRPKHSW
jgi:phosphatidylserine/phosphatidylglycerophosphate/cardiolipin synthase-like enzyme